MSKMTHVHSKNTNSCFWMGAADSFKCETDDKKLYYISLVYLCNSTEYKVSVLNCNEKKCSGLIIFQ